MTKDKKMTRIRWWHVMLWASGMAFAPNAYAQLVDEKEAPPAADAPDPESLLTVAPEELNASGADARVELLEQQLAALQAQLEDLKKALPKATPTWKGAPQFEDKSKGFSFKVRGRLQYDVAQIGDPFPNAAASLAAIPTQDLGFNSRVRRVRLGVEGAFGSGFSYKAEADFANNAVSWADVFLEYKGKGPLSVRVGHFESFQSLEQITSSRHIMFLERAQMNDAFGHARRLGAAVGFDKGDFLLRAGVFNDTINADLNNDEWLIGARAVWAPKFGANQLHFAANYQHREFSNTALNFRYRARPFLTTTGTRFVDTNTFAAKSDDVFGLEAAGVFGPLHVAAEAQFVKPKSFAPGTVFAVNEVPGTANRLLNDPSFKSYYAEVGYWFTGETRGYKKGEWDRTKPLKGFDKGGIGAVGLNLRYDYLDLADNDLRAGGVGTSLARGGTQTGYLASLIWQPIEYVRVTAQYTRSDIEGGPFAAAAVPTSTDPINDRSYNVDSFAMRFAFDF
jgi:phosphate-selective porin OprO and OprP